MTSKLLILFVFFLNSCANQKQLQSHKTNSDKDIAIEGNWEVTSIYGKSTLTKRPTLIFNKNHFSGNSGCNNYSGVYTIGEENISFGKMTSTMMVCFDNDIVNRFFSALDKVKKYRLKNDQLQFLDEKKNVLISLISKS